MPTTILDSGGIEEAIAAMAKDIVAKKSDAPWAVVGIHRGGEPLARRLAAEIERLAGQKPPLGSVDITLYRDDGFGPHDWPTVGSSRIEFDIPKHTVILVDDVLFTGRTVRAAVDAILDYGRPKAVRLAVLIDRGLRELPIAPDFVGKVIATKPHQHVEVRLRDTHSPEDVAIIDEPAKGGKKAPAGGAS